MCVCVFVCLFLSLSLHIHICMCVCAYVYGHMHLYIYIYIYIRQKLQKLCYSSSFQNPIYFGRTFIQIIMSLHLVLVTALTPSLSRNLHISCTFTLTAHIKSKHSLFNVLADPLHLHTSYCHTITAPTYLLCLYSHCTCCYTVTELIHLLPSFPHYNDTLHELV